MTDEPVEPGGNARKPKGPKRARHNYVEEAAEWRARVRCAAAILRQPAATSEVQAGLLAAALAILEE